METTQHTIARARTALVLIEFQAEWLDEDAVLYQRLVQDKAAFRAAAAAAATVLEAARRCGWNIVHAGLDLRADPGYRIFAGGKNMLGLRGAIPKAGRWTGDEVRFVEPFVPASGEFQVRGRAGASVLNNSNLSAFCRNNGIDTLLLMGFATHVCVESTLREAHDSGFNTYVVTDGCAAFTREQDDYFQQHILHHFGAGISAGALMRQMEA